MGGSGASSGTDAEAGVRTGVGAGRPVGGVDLCKLHSDVPYFAIDAPLQ